jgi:cytochrome c biogenesis protein CcdA
MTHTVLALALVGLAVAALTVPTVAPFLLAAYVLSRIAHTVLTRRAVHRQWTRIR